MRLRLLQILFLALIAFHGFGQNGSFTAAVDQTKVGVNETFKITFTITNLNGSNLRPPSFANFNVLGGPNRAEQVNNVNGAVSRSISFTYFLQPQQEGTFTIGAATLEVEGKKINSNSITMTVLGQGQKPEKPSVEDQVKQNVFARLFIDREQVYQGEQITATFKLYFRIDINNTSLVESPAFKGFWSQDLETPSHLNSTTEIYNGVQYNVAVIKKVALFPQRSGKLEIEAMGLQTVARVMVEQPSRWNWFGTFQDVQYKFETNSVSVDVKPLPVTGKQGEFSGFVGKLTMDVSLDRTATETDDPITLSIKLTGTGNMGMLDAPKIDLPNDFEVFDPKVKENISKTSTSVRGSKSYDFLIIPRRPGTFKLPPITFTYFDLESKQYVSLKSNEYILEVTGEATTSGAQVSNLNKEEVELLGQDIRFLHTGNPNLTDAGHQLLFSWEFAGMALTPALSFFLLIAFRKRQQKIAGNTVLIRKKQASKVATKLLKEASKHKSNNEEKAFYDAIAKAIWGYWGDKLNIEPSARLRDAVQASLLSKGVSETLIKKGFDVLNDCEMALYAPGAVSGGMEGTYEKAQQIINQYEDLLK